MISLLLFACDGDKVLDDTGVVASDDLQVESLGSFSTGDTGGYLGDITYTVPDGAAASLLYCGTFGDSTLGSLWTLTEPGGTQIYDGDASSNTFRASFLDDAVPVLNPITPDLPLQTGDYTANIWLGGGQSKTVDCEAIYKVASVGNNATVQLELVFVGVPGLDATSAKDDADFQAAIAQVEAEWATAGVTVSTIYTDFGGNADTYTVVNVSGDDYSEFNDLLRSSNPASDKAISIFLVEELTIDGDTVLGLAAGPPGAATLHGTSKSGAIITTVDLGSAPEDVGKIIAHEAGHFLGLYHTSEKTGQTHDPISDTPQCPASADTDGNGTVNTSECAGQGAENVMWWTLTEGDAELSGDQGWVLRRNPVAAN